MDSDGSNHKELFDISSYNNPSVQWIYNFDISPDGKKIEIKYKKLQQYLNQGYTQLS